jgi:acyl dehydratase
MSDAPLAESFAAGDKIPEISREVGWDQILKYNRYVSGGKDTKNIHTDDGIARKAGLPRALATGRHPVSFISEHLVDLFGMGFVSGGEIDVAFVKPIFPGDTVTITAEVREILPEGARRRVVLDLLMVNQEGVPVTVGTASGLVPG